MDTDFQPVHQSVNYFTPCHLNAQGQEQVEARLNLLSLIPGLTIQKAASGCCGMGGTYGIKSKNHDKSMAIGKSLFDELKESSIKTVATDCLGCKMQIQHGTGLEVIHPINVVKQAYGL